jgi:hypothetical protein
VLEFGENGKLGIYLREVNNQMRQRCQVELIGGVKPTNDDAVENNETFKGCSGWFIKSTHHTHGRAGRTTGGVGEPFVQLPAS